jgi:type IV pilus assembly protein PilM
MPVQHGVWGVDLGQSALKALRLEVIDGAVTATAFDFVEHPKILSQPDADPDQLTREALEQFLSRNDIKGDEVAISVPGQSGLARFVKLPPVEEKKIGDIVRFEAKQQIPFPLDEVVWDFQKIGSGEVTDGFAMETEIGLFAMKRDQISRSLAHFQDVNIEVHHIQMAPLALCNFVAYDQLNKGGTPAEGAEDADEGPRGKRRCVVALDIGSDSSNLVITDGDKIIWQRPIPLGGNHMTRALSKELKLTFAKAEHLKRNAAKSPPELKTILTALKPVLSDFVGEVQRSLGFFTNSHRDAQVQYMVGLGSAFRLPGFQKYLAEKLQLDVRKPAAFSRLVGDEVVNAPVFTENVLSFAVAYGLAVQGLGQAKLRTNLLPQEIRRERLIRAKKPWALAAASAFFLGAGILTGGYAMNYTAVNAKSIADAEKKADDTVKRVDERNAQASSKEQEVSRLTKDVKAVIAGKDEQLNWIKINEYIDLCLPNPESADVPKGQDPIDGGVFRTINYGPTWLRQTQDPDKDPSQWMNKLQAKYWNTDPAKKAWEMYRERVHGGQSADAPLPPDVRENLFLLDVESVDFLFTENLKQFFENAQKHTKTRSAELYGICEFDKFNPPKEGDQGWVVAITGSTYQSGGRQFIVDTLVENLTRLSRKSTPLKGGASGGTTDTAGSPPPAAPTASPAAPAAPVPVADPAADPAKTSSTAPVDPITDRISHAFLFEFDIDQNPQPGAFKIIQDSWLRFALSGGQQSQAGGAPLGGLPGAAPGGPPGGPPGSGPGGPGGAASGRDQWVPLAGGGANTGGPGGMAPGGPGDRFGSGRGGIGGFGPPGRGKGGLGAMEPGGAPPGMGAMGGGGPGGAQGGAPPGTGAAKNVKPRYEFVVMFIWREPTPSDALMNLTDAAGAPSAAAPGGAPLPGGAPVPGGAPAPGGAPSGSR